MSLMPTPSRSMDADAHRAASFAARTVDARRAERAADEPTPSAEGLEPKWVAAIEAATD